MSVKIGVMWYPRGQEVFPRMEKSIGHPFTVYPDFDTFKHKTDNEVKFLGGNVGCFKHYYRVLTDVCNSDADYVGVFSDDILYRESWIQTAISMLDNTDVGFAACFVPIGVAQRYGWGNGWHQLKGGYDAAWGGGYLFRKEVALKLLQHPFILNHRDNYEKNQQIDHAIPEAIYRMGLKQMFFVPSLIDHIGVTSTIGHDYRNIDRGVGWK